MHVNFLANFEDEKKALYFFYTRLIIAFHSDQALFHDFRIFKRQKGWERFEGKVIGQRLTYRTQGGREYINKLFLVLFSHEFLKCILARGWSARF